ncbi:DUF4097 family beta strand repeat-containing protein [Staphylococcus simulans]
MRKLLLIGMITFVAFFSLGTLVWFVHDQSNLPEERVEKTFHNKDIQDISISGNRADIKIVQGKELKLNYKGQRPINFSEHNNILKISEDKKGEIAPIINPYKRTKQEMIVEVPKKQLNDINISTDVGGIELDSVQAATTTIWNNVSDVHIHDSKLESVEMKSESSKLTFDHSTFKNGNFKIKSGGIVGDHSLVKDSIFILGSGPINFSQMANSCDIKASTKNGNITLSYLHPPKNTLLKLSPAEGEKTVKNPYFKNDKVGKGDHILEFYTNKGNITVE